MSAALLTAASLPLCYTSLQAGMLSIALKNTCDYEQSGELINHTYSALTMIINMSLLPPLICELGKFILIKLEVIVERQGTTVLVDFIHFFLFE